MDPNRATKEPAYERLAYEAALRALDKQERLIDELRNRTIELQHLFKAFRLAAVGLSAEIVILIAMVSDTLF